MSKQRRLGKGIDALLQGRDVTQLEQDAAAVVTVPRDKVHPNPGQPRKHFNEESLRELARSIEERGIIQPILAEQQVDGDYLIIAGERRWRAAELAGLTVVPVLAGVFSEDEKLEIALIENIQRQDLSPLEEAQAYAELMERTGLSQEELARRLGRSRPAIANSLRLLKLPESVRKHVDAGKLSAGHARTILGLAGSGDEAQVEQAMGDVAELTVAEGFSVRQLERLVTMLARGTSLTEAQHLLEAGPDSHGTWPTPDAAGADQTDRHARSGDEPAGDDATGHTGGSGDRGGSGAQGSRKSVEMERLEQQLIEALGTRVVIAGTDNRGKIEIGYLSMDDLERIAALILGEGAFSS